MPPAELVGIAGEVEALSGVLPKRLQHPVPRRVGGRDLGDQHRLRDQARETVDDVPGLEVASADDGRRGRRVEGPGEHTEPVEHQAVDRFQQPVRPLHRGAQRAVAFDLGTAATGQQPEALAEQTRDLGWRHRDDARRGQLDRQRDTVEPPADLPNGSGVRGVDDEPGACGLGTLAEQPSRVARLDRVE